jgi:hypothetical protein
MSSNAQRLVVQDGDGNGDLCIYNVPDNAKVSLMRLVDGLNFTTQ